ncbi:hypothetical protein [Gemmata sp.]|uniref:hypothetical protein n=1 Tax=Gemmata sp. TaxID=1914242 RepID=UPI003F70AEBE
MRPGPLALVLALLAPAAGLAADPPLPPLTFQTAPPGQLFDALRTAGDHVGGEAGVKAVTRGLKELFGAKGVEGIDLTRPVLGYAYGGAAVEDFTLVAVLPVVGEKEFLALCDRLNAVKARADEKDQGLYHLPPAVRGNKALLRFSERYAYVVYGKKPEPHAAAAALVPVARLYDPADRALVTGRVHFDRDPYAAAVASWVGARLVGDVFRDGGRMFWIPGTRAVGASLATGFEKTMFRFLLTGGAETFTARVASLDPQTGELVFDATLTPKAGTQLAKDVAAFRPAPHRFAALLDHPDTAAAFQGRLPLYTSEMRGEVVGILGEARKEVARGDPLGRPTWDELLKALVRTTKGDELDVAAALRGPDKAGAFTAVAAVALDDTAALEKEASAFFDKIAAADVKELVKWDADRAGKVSIHTLRMSHNELRTMANVFGGEKATVAFAFAPHGVVAVAGPDPVPVLKDVLALKPVAAPVASAVGNAARVVKAMEAAATRGREANELAGILGRDDTTLRAFALTLDGGKELKATAAVNLRLIPRAVLDRDIRRANRDTDAPFPPPLPK